MHPRGWVLTTDHLASLSPDHLCRWMHRSWGTALAHETLLLLRMWNSARRPALHHEGGKALLLPLLRVLVCRILWHLCPAHRWGNAWCSSQSYCDWVSIMYGVVRIPFVASDRNPTHTSLSEKWSILAHIARKVKDRLASDRDRSRDQTKPNFFPLCLSSVCLLLASFGSKLPSHGDRGNSTPSFSTCVL